MAFFDKGFSFDLSEFDPVDPHLPMFKRLIAEECLFGVLEKETLLQWLEECGIGRKLRQNGFDRYRLAFKKNSEWDQRLRILSEDYLLLELRLKISGFVPRDRMVKRKYPKEPKNYLFIDWFLSQNPTRAFRKGFVPFPGQEYPGLNVYYQVALWIKKIAFALQVDGVMNYPEYFHDAVLFHKRFLFIDPQKQALLERLIAFRRQPTLVDGTPRPPMNLHALSWKIYLGLLSIEEGGAKKAFQWPQGEMLSPIDRQLIAYFESKAYRESVHQYSRRIRFSLQDDEEGPSP